FNVLRYSLLGAGVVFGVYSKVSDRSAHEAKVAAKKWKREERLIKEAKAEYAKLNAPKTTSSAGSINWEDPNLDLGKALESLIQKLD
ncbi:hypothetical protein G210_2163, partial [Candida maltosa Xu316]